jgi:hypothetical protein
VSHTKEPWVTEEAEPSRHGSFYILESDGNRAIGRIFDNNGKENARRIVACVNACSGTSTEWLEGYGKCLGVAKNARNLRDNLDFLSAQRDGLLAALKESLQSIAAVIVDLADMQGVKLTKESVIAKSTDDSPVGKIRAAIAKCEAQP